MPATAAIAGRAFLERDEELERMDRSLAAARDGRGCVLAVEGPAGIGKTLLLSSAGRIAEDRGMRVLRARGAELEREFAFGVVRQLFEPALAAADEDERRAILQGPAQLAVERLGLAGAALAEHADGTADVSFAVLHGLFWLCANLAAERPLCLLVDDAHWADTPSLRYLAFLQSRQEGVPAALLLTLRPGEHGTPVDLLAALAGDAATELVRPAPLSVEGVGRLLREGLETPPEPGFLRACYDATKGNPFLVGQLVQALAEDAVPPSDDQAARVDALGARWAAHWILLRLGRLPRAAARLARALAVLERGEAAIAAQLAEVEPDDGVVAIDALIAAGIVAPGRPLSFVHPIVRAGVYADVGTAERARMHRAAARLLAERRAPDDLVVEHLLASEPAGDEWVSRKLVDAARRAARAGAPELAALHLRRALAEPPEPGERSRLLLELGIAEDNAGEPASRAHMRAAMAEAPDARSRISAALVLGHALGRDNRFEEALEVLDEATTSAAGQDEDRLTRAAEALAASVSTFSPATAPANARRVRAARALADTDPGASHEQLALAAQLAVRMNEPADVAKRLALRALERSRGELPEPTDLPWFHQCSITLLWAEAFSELAALLDDAVATARARGDAGLFTGALAYRSWLALRRGDLRGAEADAITALDATDLPAPAMYRLRSAAVLLETLTEQGRLDEADRFAGTLGDDVSAPSTVGANLRASRGRLRLAQRAAAPALEDFLAAGEIAAATEFVSPSCLPWRSQAALAHLALGDRAAALPLAEEELDLARAFGAPRALGVALRTAGLADEGAAAEERLREAVDVLERGDTPLELARARADLGAFLRRAKRRAESREHLAAALDAAHHCGARLLASHAETELRATGAKPRRVRLTGVDALTASERRVADLAAHGLSNREIAQTLFVTLRTVEGHLTSAFQKLDIGSRGQLAHALERPS